MGPIMKIKNRFSYKKNIKSVKNKHAIVIKITNIDNSRYVPEIFIIKFLSHRKEIIRWKD